MCGGAYGGHPNLGFTAASQVVSGQALDTAPPTRATFDTLFDAIHEGRRHLSPFLEQNPVISPRRVRYSDGHSVLRECAQPHLDKVGKLTTKDGTAGSTATREHEVCVQYP